MSECLIKLINMVSKQKLQMMKMMFPYSVQYYLKDHDIFLVNKKHLNPIVFSGFFLLYLLYVKIKEVFK